MRVKLGSGEKCTHTILSTERDNLEDESLDVKTIIKWAYRILAVVKGLMNFHS
jgi:hypothetical protein